MSIIIKVKVTPNASKNEILHYKEEVLALRIKGVPEKGKVNANLIRFLAEQFHISQSDISILKGTTSRLKLLNINNLSIEQFNHFIYNALH